VARTVWSGCRY